MQFMSAHLQACVRRPFANSWIALCYTFNNLLYFDALSALSAVAYQVTTYSLQALSDLLITCCSCFHQERRVP